MKPKSKTTPATPQTRVGIYTRQSVATDLEYGSIDAQREAVEAYVASQRGEGWMALPDHYDDHGFSGGNVDRPAFQRLLADVEAGKVDVIAAYKIDRVSRSLSDFTQFMGALERRGVGFVSTTQSFDTRTSMGRLTLNILASFSQFEREVISERTRDKIAATRKKGMWTGGRPVLGYDVRDKDHRWVHEGGRGATPRMEANQGRDRDTSFAVTPDGVAKIVCFDCGVRQPVVRRSATSYHARQGGIIALDPRTLNVMRASRLVLIEPPRLVVARELLPVQLLDG